MGLKRYNGCIWMKIWRRMCLKNKNSAEGVIAPAGAKVTGATIRTWLLNKFISFLAVLTWKNWVEKNVDKVPSGAHIFRASPIPSNGYIFGTDFSYHTWYSPMIMEHWHKICKSHWSMKYRSRSWVKVPANSVHQGEAQCKVWWL